MANSRRPTIAITGAAGFVGAALTQYFLKKKWRVVALVRGAHRYQSDGSVTYVEYDLLKPFDTSLFKDVDYLVHAAYIKQDRKHPNSMELNVTAAERLLSASRKYNLKKNVFISSMSAHDDAVSVYGRQKLAIEKLFNSDGDVNLRPGLIIGNGGIVKNMVSFMKSKHMVPLVGGGMQPLQSIGINDVVRAVERSLTTDAHGTFTVAYPRVYTYKEFYRTLSKQLGIKVLFVPVPFRALLALVRLAGWLHIPLGINEENVRGLHKLRFVDTRKDLRALGITPEPLKTSLKRAGVV